MYTKVKPSPFLIGAGRKVTASLVPSLLLCKKNYPVFLTKDLSSHKYACLMAKLSSSISKLITDWAIENVLDEHLGPKGREFNPHITIKYGFMDESEETLQAIRALLGRHGPIHVQMKGISFFDGENKDGTPLYVEIESQDLIDLNRELSSSFDTKDTHPEYNPHATIAYLTSPEVANSYCSCEHPFTGTTCVIEEAVWSGKDGKETIIPLSFMGRGLDIALDSYKDLSYLSTTSGGALVPPPAVARKKKKRTILIPDSPFRNRVGLFGTKGAGQPCRRGETASKTGCIPLSLLGPRRKPEQWRRRAEKPREEYEQAGGQVGDRGAETSDPFVSPFIAKFVEIGSMTWDVLRATGKMSEELEQSIREWEYYHIQDSISVLPEENGLVARGVWLGIRLGGKPAWAVFVAGRKLALRISRKMKLSDQEMKIFRGVMSAVDISTYKHADISISALVDPQMAGANAPEFPIGSMTYLAYSSADDPTEVIKRAVDEVRNGSVEAETGFSFEEMAEWLVSGGDSDYRMALILGALDIHKDIRKAFAAVKGRGEKQERSEKSLSIPYVKKSMLWKRKNQGMPKEEQGSKIKPITAQPKPPQPPKQPQPEGVAPPRTPEQIGQESQEKPIPAPKQKLKKPAAAPAQRQQKPAPAQQEVKPSPKVEESPDDEDTIYITPEHPPPEPIYLEDFDEDVLAQEPKKEPKKGTPSAKPGTIKVTPKTIKVTGDKLKVGNFINHPDTGVFLGEVDKIEPVEDKPGLINVYYYNSDTKKKGTIVVDKHDVMYEKEDLSGKFEAPVSNLVDGVIFEDPINGDIGVVKRVDPQKDGSVKVVYRTDDGVVHSVTYESEQIVTVLPDDAALEDFASDVGAVAKETTGGAKEEIPDWDSIPETKQEAPKTPTAEEFIETEPSTPTEETPAKKYTGNLEDIRKAYKSIKDSPEADRIAAYIVTEEPGVPEVSYPEKRIEVINPDPSGDTDYNLKDPNLRKLHEVALANIIEDDDFPTAHDSIKKYTGMTAFGWNAILRGRSAWTSEVPKEARELGKAIMKHGVPIEPGTRLDREISGSVELKSKLYHSVGKVIQDPAFTSTSIKENPPRSNFIFFRFTTGTGVRGLYLSPSVSQIPKEQEMLLPPGQRFLITKTEKVGDALVVHALILPTIPEQFG